LPDWERVLACAARLQQLVPGTVLVGGSAAAVHVRHRRSAGADHVSSDLKQRFDEVLADLEAVAGWKTARIRRPVLILGSLDGVETGVRQLIRSRPLATIRIKVGGSRVTLPTLAEMLCIKAALVLARNATRDYIDFAALAHALGKRAIAALARMDQLYPQPQEESTLQQLLRQLSDPRPYDLADLNLESYKVLAPRWRNWETVGEECARVAVRLAEGLLGKFRRSTGAGEDGALGATEVKRWARKRMARGAAQRRPKGRR